MSYFVYIYICYVSLSGSNANTEERKAALKVAQEFIKQKNYSSKTQVHCLLPPCAKIFLQNIRFVYFLLKDIILLIFNLETFYTNCKPIISE